MAETAEKMACASAEEKEGKDFSWNTQKEAMAMNLSQGYTKTKFIVWWRNLQNKFKTQKRILDLKWRETQNDRQ